MTTTSIQTQTLGYPRIGRKRELKKAIESFWRSEISESELRAVCASLRKDNWLKQSVAGISRIPSNDFSLYDQVLDMTCLLGNVPPRFEWDQSEIDLDLYFRMARGKSGEGSESAGCCGSGAELACEMTKWFDTNYHYIVPEFSQSSSFQISSSKVFTEYGEAKAAGIATIPVLIGPLTYLTIGKEVNAEAGFNRFDLADSLIEVYVNILKRLAESGARSVQIDEPALVLDLTDEQRRIVARAFAKFSEEIPDLEIQVATYFGEVMENLETLLNLPVSSIHIDAVRGGNEISRVVSGVADSDKSLSIGVVDGRNIWKSDLKKVFGILDDAATIIGKDRVIVSTSCSLLHVPVGLELEAELDKEIVDWLAFAEEKLEELGSLGQALQQGAPSSSAFIENSESIARRRRSNRVHVPEVQARTVTLDEEMFQRVSPFESRRPKQREKLQLPCFPTTTIGSFPQTAEVRSARAKHRSGEWNSDSYNTFLRLRTSDCIQMQERAGLDVIVHGEFERNDMVEYFGEKLEGFLFTRFGWVQSYGSRCVKPPIIYGDISRPEPMTVDWARFAQSVTEKPVKGMLTGPVTILQWSFVRDDQTHRETAYQIALAIRDEVNDLEEAGLPIIQIDEAAIREGLPLRRGEWDDYLEWAVKAFRLSSSGVRDETQIHTHMCYSEFNDMLDAIVEMDADVTTIENARSNLELLEALSSFHYPNEIGPGVYDIHSPRVPTTGEMVTLLEQAGTVIPNDQIWVNPDCGLKTRAWEDVKPSLERMVAAAENRRQCVVNA